MNETFERVTFGDLVDEIFSLNDRAKEFRLNRSSQQILDADQSRNKDTRVNGQSMQHYV
jgi:hypothetical protein